MRYRSYFINLINILGEGVSTTIGVRAPFLYNVAWTTGWESGIAFTNQRWYISAVWRVEGHDGLISTNK